LSLLEQPPKTSSMSRRTSTFSTG